MNAEEHARVKEIFFAAIDLPEHQQVTFVEQSCVGQEQLLPELRSLLSHHRNATILPVRPASEQAQEEASLLSRKSAATHKITAKPNIDTELVLADLWEENRGLLQRRLRVFAEIMCLVIVGAASLRLIERSTNWPWVIYAVVLTLLIVCRIGLGRKRQPKLLILRLLELSITAAIGFLIAISDLYQMHELSILGDAVGIARESERNYVNWSIFILAYGVFIPNTWWRAASVFLPIAVIPYLVDWVSRSMHPTVAEVLVSGPIGLPLPFVSAGIAISAAKVIHSARLSAFRARRFAQYRLVREIGAGGMGRVYEATHVMLKRPCAIKVIRPESLSAQNLASFEREVRSTASLTHPNTIEVFDFGQTIEGMFFYVMELLPGLNLRELVLRTGPLPAARAINILRQICGALQEAHDAGMIHRDIKPANILVSRRGGIFDFAKLLDFGLVRLASAQQFLLPSVGTKHIAGTPAYMAPEQILNYEHVDPRTDIYSLGIVAYFLLTGQAAFDRDSEIEILLAQVHEAPIAPVTLIPTIGIELSDIVVKCLEKAPEDRFQSVRLLRDALNACLPEDPWTQADAALWWAGYEDE